MSLKNYDDFRKIDDEYNPFNDTLYGKPRGQRHRERKMAHRDAWIPLHHDFEWWPIELGYRPDRMCRILVRSKDDGTLGMGYKAVLYRTDDTLCGRDADINSITQFEYFIVLGEWNELGWPLIEKYTNSELLMRTSANSQHEPEQLYGFHLAGLLREYSKK